MLREKVVESIVNSSRPISPKNMVVSTPGELPAISSPESSLSSALIVITSFGVKDLWWNKKMTQYYEAYVKEISDRQAQESTTMSLLSSLRRTSRQKNQTLTLDQESSCRYSCVFKEATVQY